MANLDTKQKRGSSIGIDMPWVRVYPDPDGTISVADRQQTAFKYSGIDSTFVAGTSFPYRTLMGVGA